MDPELLDDYRWLVGEQGREWLSRVEGLPGTVVAESRQLRKRLSARRAHLVLEQCELRRRAASKFAAAAEMYFTRRGLEQSTDQWLAELKARRFPAGAAIADLCCGIGGDLLGLAARGQVTAVDRDPVAVLLAEANCRSLALPLDSISAADATSVPLAHCDAWHIDPDRRPIGHRTSQLDFSEPSAAVIARLLAAAPNAAIKLAPAATLAADWADGAERQWLGSGRECRQQVAWFGNLANHPGCHSVAIANSRHQTSDVFVGQPHEEVDTTTCVAEYVFEPHAAVLAAGLNGALAARHGLRTLSAGIAYLTGDQPVDDPLLDAFHVHDVLPLDERRLRTLLRQRNVGRLEVKKRGVSLDPLAVQRKLRGSGTHEATLLITPLKGSVHAIVAQRVKAP